MKTPDRYCNRNESGTVNALKFIKNQMPQRFSNSPGVYLLVRKQYPIFPPSQKMLTFSPIPGYVNIFSLRTLLGFIFGLLRSFSTVLASIHPTSFPFILFHSHFSLVSPYFHTFPQNDISQFPPKGAGLAIFQYTYRYTPG